MLQSADDRRPRSIRSTDAMARGAVLFALPVALAIYTYRGPICRASSQRLAKFRFTFYSAVAASAITYRLVENPVRNCRGLKSRMRLTLAIGVVLSLLTILVAQWQIASHFGTWNPLAPALGSSANLGRTFATTAQVLETVKAAQSINLLPSSVAASLPTASTPADQAKATGRFDCQEIAASHQFRRLFQVRVGPRVRAVCGRC